MTARSIGALCWWALVALQPAWHLWWHPAAAFPAWLVVAILWLPMLPPSIMLLRRHPAGLFWAAVVGLLYFCHGVMEAWAAPPVRIAALLEVLFASGVVLAVGTDGLQRRRAQRAAAPP